MKSKNGQISVGLTGGIGSGKSTVSRLFEMQDIPVFHADECSKYLLNNDVALKTRVKETFGEDIYRKGELDRRRLASIIFNDEKKRRLLESISHPAVLKDFEQWKDAHKDSRIVVKEAALLFEAGTFKGLDKMVVVAAPLELRIQRIMKRDGLTHNEVLSRLKSQWPEEEKTARADYVIYNDEKQLLIPQVLKFLSIV